LALIHYQFEAIHPFRDGNGRIGRLLVPLLLRAHGRLADPVLYISSFFERNRATYVDLMLRVSHVGDWQPWIQFFLRAMEEAAEESIAQANALLSLREEYRHRVEGKWASSLLQKLVDTLFVSPSATIGSVAALLDVTKTSASKSINRLVDEGILREATGRARGQIFLAQGILDIVSNEAPSQPELSREREQTLPLVENGEPST
jgi:Fic family protein